MGLLYSCSSPWGDHQAQWVWQEDLDQWWVSHVFAWTFALPIRFLCYFFYSFWNLQIKMCRFSWSYQYQWILWRIYGTNILGDMLFLLECWYCNWVATLPVWFSRCYQLCTPSVLLDLLIHDPLFIWRKWWKEFPFVKKKKKKYHQI